MTTRRRRYVRRIPYVLASALLLLGLAECLLRLTGLAPLQSLELPAGHPLAARLKPNECETAGGPKASYFVPMCTNALGLRDRDHAADESPRVLGLGDEATSGWGVEQADTFLAHLERALRLALPSSRAGVFNAGLANTSQAHQEALLRHLYEKVRPDIVVLAFAEADDADQNIFWNPKLGAFPDLGELSPQVLDAYRDELNAGGASENFASKHSALVRFWRQLGSRMSEAAELRLLGKRLEAHGLNGAPLSRRASDEAGRRFRSTYGDRYDGDWALTEVLLERMRKFVENRGARLVLLRIPGRPSVDDKTWNEARKAFCGSDAATVRTSCGTLVRDRTAHRLESYARGHALLYVDPADDLTRSIARGESVFLPTEHHLGRLGHARIGERLARVLVPALGGKFGEPTAGATPVFRKERLVGAYWYPWYRTRDWTWFTDYTPQGGAYASSDPGAIDNQLRWAERGELDFLVIELLAEHNADSRLNAPAVDALLGALEERRARGHSRLRFAMMSDIAQKEATILTEERWLKTTRHHLDQIFTKYVEEYGDAYVHVDGKPLVVVFSPPVPIDDRRFTIVRPYWVSHQQWKDWSRKDDLLPFWDTYPQTVTDSRFMSVVPGYNDWRLERRPQVAPYLPRLGGRTFVQQWRRVFEVAPEVVLVYSFNEYYEQTQIEPTRELGDRYLLLNQLLARRFKDGRPYSDAELERLPDVLEPSVAGNEEKVSWLPIDDHELVSRGLERVSNGRAVFREQAELEIPIPGDASVVLGLTYEPNFEPCAWMSVTFADENPPKTDYFKTELAQLAVLRDLSIPASKKRVKLVLRRETGRECRDGGTRPLVLTGVARYPVPTKERQNFQVWQDNVELEGFWDIERHSSGHPFSWSRGNSKVTISQLTPGKRYRVTLTFVEKATFDDVYLGPDPEHMQRVAITQGLTATIPQPIAVSPAGTLAVCMRTPTWRPSTLHGAKDERALGLALRLIALDRVDDATVR